MINSAISSSHHFYVVFIESNKMTSLDRLASAFPKNSLREVIKIGGSQKNGVTHIQAELNRICGSETLLSRNRSNTSSTSYYYDFYLGVADAESRTFFVCYPYSSVVEEVDRWITDLFKDREFNRANVHDTLTYMKERKTTKRTQVENDGFNFEIVKYSAEVKEEANADRVSLVGSRPLESRIFDVLMKDKRISIETTSLKLSCKRQDGQELELAFDRLGNFRFWMKREQQVMTLSILQHMYRFLAETKVLHKTSVIKSKTLLDEESN